MEYKSIKGFSGWSQIGFLAVFLGVGFILTALIQGVMFMGLMPETGSLGEMESSLKKIIMNPENVQLLRFSQVLGTFCLFFIPAVVFSVVVNGKNAFWLGFNKHLTALQILLAFGLIYAAGICASPLADLSKAIVHQFPSLDAAAQKLENAYNEQVLAMSNLKNWYEYLMALLIMAFFPAMFEELFFRGAMQNLFVKWWKKPILAILITSLIFSLVHMSIYLFLTRALLGFVLGLIYYKTKNIWVNIIAHFLNNAVAVSMLFYISQTSVKPDFSKVDPKVEWYIGLVGLAGLITLFYLLKKNSAIQVARIDAQESILIAKADPFNAIAQTKPE